MRVLGARLASAFLVGALLLIAQAAQAQPIQGPYVGAAAGYDLPQNIRAAAPPASGFGSGHLRLEQNGGYALLGSAGYALGDGWRFELEGDFARTGIHDLARTPAPATTSGHLQSYGVMVNALYDLDIGNRYIFPYLGVGAGYMWSHLDGFNVASPGTAAVFHSGATSGAFAWQAMLGTAFPVPNMPGLSLTAEYRFRDVTSGETFGGTGFAGGTGSLKLGSQFSHLFLLGVRYAFNVIPPAPPPAATPAAAAVPAPAPERSYLVFFDWDSAALTARARDIVHTAAQNVSRVQVTRIEVNGYTDTSGSPAYNRALSERRGRAVAAELVRDGVAANLIVIHGFGETHLLVPTGPNVREPQNRRVEIILH
ncbi:MAG: OmpA family protein [Rhodospirillales bacterium]|jgi:opacity protein-like surface antigen|nr:OmpA family protein [Rhodospirillales bacterium]